MKIARLVQYFCKIPKKVKSQIITMQNFNNTLNTLDNMISKLEVSTGGEVARNVDAPPKAETKVQVKNEEPKQKVEQVPKTEVKVQEKKQKKEKKAEKKEKVDKKEQKEVKEEKGNQQKKEKKEQQATIEDFAAIDIRIGEIVQVWKHPESEKLYCQKINVCGEVRQIASGLQQFVPQQQMTGLVIVMANLKPRPLAKFMSNGMVVCASNHEHTDVKIIRPQGANGQRVFLEGHENLFAAGAIAPVLNPKKKILERCLQHFKTDAEGYVVWKGIRAKTSGGYLKTEINNGTVS